VFVSYRRDDEPWLTQVVVDDLRSSLGEGRVFHDLTSIAPGAAVSAELTTALADLTALVACSTSRTGFAVRSPPGCGPERP
jgi:hypothetical protein